MKIEKYISYSVRCCGCGDVSEFDNTNVASEEEALECFENEGWETIKGLDYCFECAERAKEENMSEL